MLGYCIDIKQSILYLYLAFLIIVLLLNNYSNIYIFHLSGAMLTVYAVFSFRGMFDRHFLKINKLKLPFKNIFKLDFSRKVLSKKFKKSLVKSVQRCEK